MGGDRTNNVQLLSAQTATGNSEVHSPRGANMLFQCDGTTSAGAGSATIIIEGHNGGGVYSTIDTLSLTLATTASADFGVTTAPFEFVRARISAISGTDATVNCWMSVEV